MEQQTYRMTRPGNIDTNPPPASSVLEPSFLLPPTQGPPLHSLPRLLPRDRFPPHHCTAATAQVVSTKAGTATEEDFITAREITSNVGPSKWSADDVHHIEPIQVMVRSEVDQPRKPAFILKFPHFESDIPETTAQGYAPDTVGVPTW